MKYLKYILIFLFLGLIPICCAPKYKHYYIYEIGLETFKDQHTLTKIISSDTLTNDSVFFLLNLKTHFLAQGPTINLTPGCYATTKPKAGYLGLKYPLKEISIISNKTFSQRSPGSHLQDLFKLSGFKEMEEFSTLLSWLNESSPAAYPNEYVFFTFYLTKRPEGTDDLSQRFTFIFEYESGHKHFVSTNLVWK